MAPKTASIIVPLLVLVSFNFSQQSLAQKPVIHITSIVSGVHVEIKKAGTGGKSIADTELIVGKELQIRVDAINVEYNAFSTYDRAPASVYVYDRWRDKGRADIYWKVDDWGWSLSYNNRSFEQVEPWESE